MGDYVQLKNIVKWNISLANHHELTQNEKEMSAHLQNYVNTCRPSLINTFQKRSPPASNYDIPTFRQQSPILLQQYKSTKAA